MAKDSGTNSELYVSTDDSVYNEVNHLKNLTINKRVESIDTTTNDDAGYTSRKAGNKTVGFTAVVGYDYTGDAEHATIITRFYSGATIYFRCRPTVGTGLHQIKGEAVIDDVQIAANNNQMVEMTVTATFTGTVTTTVQ